MLQCLLCRMFRTMALCMFTFILSKLATPQTMLMRIMKADSPSTKVDVSLLPHAHTHTLSFNGQYSRTPWVNWDQNGKIILDFNRARYDGNSGHIMTTRIPPFNFLQGICPSCHQTNSCQSTEGNILFQYCFIRIN